MSGIADPTDAVDLVSLELSATTDHLRLVRLLVVGLASRHGADVDDIDDIRMAADEVCAHVIDQAGPAARLAVDVRADGGVDGNAARIRVAAASIGLDHLAPFDELRDLVIDTTSDEHGIDVDDHRGPIAWFERALRAAPVGQG